MIDRHPTTPDRPVIRPPVGTPQGAVDATRALTREQLAALWRLDVPLREKTLWRMLYETSARAEEIVSLDVEDLELPGKPAR